ncbi:UNVERIFIED_ORG: hypothetical protein J2Y78_002038 [Buttiauxella agrestis ATCC 33320]
MNTTDLYKEMQRHKDAAKLRQDALAERFTQAWGFYRGELPAVMMPGDVAARNVMWEAFETIHPSLVAMFTDSQKSPVAFSNDTKGENKLAAAVTKAVHAAALAVNGWDMIIYLALKQCLITGNQAGLVGYDSKTYTTDKITFDKDPAEAALIQQKIITTAGYSVESELSFEDIDGVATVSGWMQGKREVKFPVISLIEFKNFFLHPKATNPQDSIYSAYAEEITNAEAYKRGYKKSAVEAGAVEDTNAGRSLDTSMLVVGDMNAEGRRDLEQSTLDTMNDLITVYHHYWRGCYNSADENLWHVITTSTEYISHEAVGYCPLIWGAMSAVPNSAHGESLYDFCKSAQEGTTRARRAIQRSADFAAYPDMEVTDSLLTSEARAALNDRSEPGRVYVVKQKGAISRIPTSDVPQAMQMLNQELNQDAERVRQGSAGQAQAMSKTNQSGIAIALTQAKEEINENQIAKVFAETFIKPAYGVFLMVLQEMGNVLDVEGVKIPFKMLRDDIGLKVDIKSAADRAQAAANILTVYQDAAQKGTLPDNFQPENVYNIYADFLRAVTNDEDITRYLTPPSEMPKPSEFQKKLQAVMAACQLRHAIATTKLAEGKVEEQAGTTQKLFNEAAKALAQIEEIMQGIDIDKARLVLDADKSEKEALLDAAELANRAQPNPSESDKTPA